MKTLIFGYPQCGKTSLFLALAGGDFKNNTKAMVKVPEPRLNPLIKLFNPKKVTYTEIEYIDYNEPIKDNSLNGKVLNDIKPFDCIMVVLDAFSGFNDPYKQWKNIESEFIIADLAVVENKLLKSKKIEKNEKDLLAKAKEILDKEIPLRESNEISDAQELKGYRFLSAKPVIYVWNVTENNIHSFNPPEDKKNQMHIVLSTKLEQEMRELEDIEELKIFMEEFGIKEPALNKVIKTTYNLLNLITFLTAGEKEVRAWPLRKGSKAPEAGGVIHSDIQRGFIRAEVLSWEDFLKYGDFKTAKKNGALRLEGKDYVVKDGDIITFYFNV